MTHSLRRRVFLTILVGSVALLSGQAVSAWSVGTPIVTYFDGPGQWGSSSLTGTNAQQVASGGFNLAWATTFQQVQLAQSYGLRTLYQSTLFTPASLDGGVMQAQLNSMIDQLSVLPGFYGYYLKDEPGASEFAGLGALVAHIRARDPNHLAYINLFPNYATPTQLGTSSYDAYLSQYISTVQPSLLSYDHYQFGAAGNDRSGYLQNLGQVATASKQAGVPFMNIVQTSGVWGRIPNANEMRFLVYSTLAYGAQGISYFQYESGAWPPADDGGITWPDGTAKPIYSTLQTLNPEFVAVAKQFQSLKWIGTYLKGYLSYAMPPGTTQLPANSPFNISSVSNSMTYYNGVPLKGVLFGLFDADGTAATDATFALVENLDYTTDKTYTISGPGNMSLFNASTGTWMALGSNQVIAYLAPGGGKLVGLTSAIPFYWTGVGSTTTWSTATGLNNWRLGSGTANDYADSAGVTFDDSATGLTANISTANVTPGSVVFNNTAKNFVVTGSNGIVGTATVTKQGTGKVTLSSVNTYTGVTTVEAGTLQLNGAAKAQSPVISGGGANIKGGRMVFDYTSESSPATTIQSLLTASYDAAGPSRFDTGKFKSSTANSTHGLGWLDDGVLKQVTVAYTVYGDTDLNRTVDFTDLNTLLSNYGTGTKWSQGDFNYSGTVNFTDLNTLLSNYGMSAGGSVNGAGLDAQAIQLLSGAGFNVVPEPSSFVLLAIGLLGLLAYAWRKRK